MLALRPYLHWIAEQQSSMHERLWQWSAINSGSFNLAGLQQMAQQLEQAFSALQAEQPQWCALTPLEFVDEQGKMCKTELGQALLLTKRPRATYQILLCGHMDTVFSPQHTFQKPRLLADNILNGPGVADMKGGLLIMLYALLALEQTPWASNIGWQVFINPDEEIGSRGSAHWLTQLAMGKQLALVFEPAIDDSGTLAAQRKGSGDFTLVAHGRAAHAGRAPEQGRNALRAIADAIVALDQLNQQRQGVTVNVGRVIGGGPINIVPDLAVSYFGVRTITTDDEHWLTTQFQQIIDKINQRDGIKLELHGYFTRTPKPLTPETQQLLELIKSIGTELHLTIKWQATGGCCDGNNLAAAGLPVVDTLGVRGGKIHSQDEYVLLDSLVERAQLTAALLIKIAMQAESTE
ncbi:MAG: hydrolase [Gammaproteobacteria bacterium]